MSKVDYPEPSDGPEHLNATVQLLVAHINMLESKIENVESTARLYAAMLFNLTMYLETRERLNLVIASQKENDEPNEEVLKTLYKEMNSSHNRFMELQGELRKTIWPEEEDGQ